MAGSLRAEKGSAPSTPLRWTSSTPDEMLELALRRAAASGEGALAGLAVAYSLADRASAGKTRAGPAAPGKGDNELSAQARWLAAGLDPAPRAAVPGLVRTWSVLGPFQDTGGGLARREGPEDATQTWGDPSASYAWGAYEVKWREVPRELVSARGVPLDLMIY